MRNCGESTDKDAKRLVRTRLTRSLRKKIKLQPKQRLIKRIKNKRLFLKDKLKKLRLKRRKQIRKQSKKQKMIMTIRMPNKTKLLKRMLRNHGPLKISLP